MRYFLILLTIVFCMSACDGGGSSGGGGTMLGNCDVCAGSGFPTAISQGNCAPGYWCAPFDDGPTRCVPDHVKPGSRWTCRVR